METIETKRLAYIGAVRCVTFLTPTELIAGIENDIRYYANTPESNRTSLKTVVGEHKQDVSCISWKEVCKERFSPVYGGTVHGVAGFKLPHRLLQTSNKSYDTNEVTTLCKNLKKIDTTDLCQNDYYSFMDSGESLCNDYLIIAFGIRKLRLYYTNTISTKFSCNNNDIYCLDPLLPCQIVDDRILAVECVFLDTQRLTPTTLEEPYVFESCNNVFNKKLQLMNCIVIVAYAHNYIDCLRINAQEIQYHLQPLSRVHCTSDSLLYSFCFMKNYMNSPIQLLCAAGTVDSRIIVWPLLKEILTATPTSLSVATTLFRLTPRPLPPVTPLVILEGHRGVLFKLKFFNFGKLLCSASDDREVRVWDHHDDNNTFLLKSILKGHKARIWDIDSLLLYGITVILTAGEDGECRIWNLEGTCLHVLLGHMGRGVTCLNCINDLIPLVATGGMDGDIKIWTPDSFLTKSQINQMTLSESIHSMHHTKESCIIDFDLFQSHQINVNLNDWIRDIILISHDMGFFITNFGHLVKFHVCESNKIQPTTQDLTMDLQTNDMSSFFQFNIIYSFKLDYIFTTFAVSTCLSQPSKMRHAAKQPTQLFTIGTTNGECLLFFDVSESDTSICSTLMGHAVTDDNNTTVNIVNPLNNKKIMDDVSVYPDPHTDNRIECHPLYYIVFPVCRHLRVDKLSMCSISPFHGFLSNLNLSLSYDTLNSRFLFLLSTTHDGQIKGFLIDLLHPTLQLKKQNIQNLQDQHPTCIVNSDGIYSIPILPLILSSQQHNRFHCLSMTVTQFEFLSSSQLKNQNKDHFGSFIMFQTVTVAIGDEYGSVHILDVQLYFELVLNDPKYTLDDIDNDLQTYFTLKTQNDQWNHLQYVLNKFIFSIHFLDSMMSNHQCQTIPNAASHSKIYSIIFHQESQQMSVPCMNQSIIVSQMSALSDKLSSHISMLYQWSSPITSFYTSGGDGCIRTYRSLPLTTTFQSSETSYQFHLNATCRFPKLNTIITPIICPITEALEPCPLFNYDYIAAFKQSDFVLWCKTSSAEIWKCRCGGSRRPFSLFVSELAHQQKKCLTIGFVAKTGLQIYQRYFNHESLPNTSHVVSQQQNDQTIPSDHHSLSMRDLKKHTLHCKSGYTKNACVSLIGSYHGRQIICGQWLSHIYCITGSEDNTIRELELDSDHDNFLQRHIHTNHPAPVRCMIVCHVDLETYQYKEHDHVSQSTCCPHLNYNKDLLTFIISGGARQIINIYYYYNNDHLDVHYSKLSQYTSQRPLLSHLYTYELPLEQDERLMSLSVGVQTLLTSCLPLKDLNHISRNDHSNSALFEHHLNADYKIIMLNIFIATSSGKMLHIDIPCKISWINYLASSCSNLCSFINQQSNKLKKQLQFKKISVQCIEQHSLLNDVTSDKKEQVVKKKPLPVYCHMSQLFQHSSAILSTDVLLLSFSQIQSETLGFKCLLITGCMKGKISVYLYHKTMNQLNEKNYTIQCIGSYQGHQLATTSIQMAMIPSHLINHTQHQDLVLSPIYSLEQLLSQSANTIQHNELLCNKESNSQFFDQTIDVVSPFKHNIQNYAIDNQNNSSKTLDQTTLFCIIVSTGDDNSLTLQVIDLKLFENNTEIHLLGMIRVPRAHGTSIRDVYISYPFILSIGWDKMIRVWKLSQISIQDSLHTHTSCQTSLSTTTLCHQIVPNQSITCPLDGDPYRSYNYSMSGLTLDLIKVISIDIGDVAGFSVRRIDTPDMIKDKIGITKQQQIFRVLMFGALGTEVIDILISFCTTQ